MTKAITTSQKTPQNSPTSFPGSLFSASISRWSRDPGCDCPRDHLFIQNRRVGGYSSVFGREDDKMPHPSSRFFFHPDSWRSRDQSQPGSLFQQLREAEKRDPGNEVENSQQTCTANVSRQDAIIESSNNREGEKSRKLISTYIVCFKNTGAISSINNSACKYPSRETYSITFIDCE